MTQDLTGYVKKETMILVAVAALVMGFLGGIVFSVYKSPAPGPQMTAKQPGGGPPKGQMPGGAPQMTPDMASRLLSLEKEVQTNPANADAWTELGNIYYDTQKFEKAINTYTKSLELKPNVPGVLTDMGVMYRSIGQPDKALDAFRKAMAADSKHEPSRLNTGVVLLYDMNDKAGAIKAWEELVALNPNFRGPTGQTVKEMVEGLKTDAAKPSMPMPGQQK